MSIAGTVIANIDFTTPEVLELVRSSLPVVTIDFTFDGRIAIVSDNVKGMKDLVDYVCSMGHRRIAYIHGDDNSVTRDRISSFHRALYNHGISVPDSYLKKSRYRDGETTMLCMQELLELKDRPTCVFTPDDFSAVGAYHAVQEAGLKVPDDISIVGYDGIPMSQALFPKLTTLWQDTKQIGQRAAEELIALIETPKTTLIEKELIVGQLMEGGSVLKIG